jgi:hypothetical protein
MAISKRAGFIVRLVLYHLVGLGGYMAGYYKGSHSEPPTPPGIHCVLPVRE